MEVQRLARESAAPQQKVLVSVEEAAILLSLGRTVIYALVRRGDLASIKVGRTRRIPYAALLEFVRGQLP